LPTYKSDWVPSEVACERLGCSENTLNDHINYHKKKLKNIPSWARVEGRTKGRTLYIDMGYFHAIELFKSNVINRAHALYYEAKELGAKDAEMAAFVAERAQRCNEHTYAVWMQKKCGQWQ